MQIKVYGGSCIGTIYYNGKAKVMVIDNVKVDSDKRRMGIGMVLMEKVLSIALDNKIDSIELLVNPDNYAAKGLYNKMGFQKTDKEHHRMILRKFNE